MNTRIQVEHTVTEKVFGVDLVREQMRLAAGEPLQAGDRHPPARPRHRGAHQRRGSGHLRAVAGAHHRRSTCRAGSACASTPTSTTSTWCRPFYDSLLAKLIVHAENRPAALARLRRALDEFVVEGIKTNLDFLRRLTRPTPTTSPARWIPTSSSGCRPVPM